MVKRGGGGGEKRKKIQKAFCPVKEDGRLKLAGDLRGVSLSVGRLSTRRRSEHQQALIDG